MRSAPEALVRLIGDAIGLLGYELVGVELLQRGHGALLRIYIDKEGGITLDDCETVSHQVSGVLDVEDPIHGSYDLEVSSPGLDRPLFTRDQFARFSGHRATIRMGDKIGGRRRFVGLLRGVEDDAVLLLEDDDNLVRLPLERVETARLVPEF